MTTAARVADRLKSIRMARGISVTTLSERTGIADKTLRRHLLRPDMISFGNFEAICDALDVRSEDVLNLDIDVETILTARAA